MTDYPMRQLVDGQIAQLRVYNVITGEDQVVLESTGLLFEAPNWTLDGRHLVVNGDGRLFRVPLLEPALELIDLPGIPQLNNDHVLDPDGEHIVLSAMDFQLYRAPLAGGVSQRITDPAAAPFMHFLHGVSPDGQQLAFVGLVAEPEPTWKVLEAEIHVVGVDGMGYRQITFSGKPSDGPEYSPKGGWLYLNTEAFSSSSQIARVRLDGSSLERLVTSTTVDWFPHISPDGARAVYLTYPAATKGHPADLPVTLELVAVDDWANHQTVAKLLGGQGTINVNSWSPDSTRFAYVAYPSA